MKTIDPKNIVLKLSSFLNIVSGAALFVLMALITINVIGRAVFKSPVSGTYDYTGFLTVIIIGCGLAYCSVNNGHIEIEYFVGKFRRKISVIIIFAGRALSVLLLSIYSYALFGLGMKLYRSAEVSVTTRTPQYIFVFLIAACFVVFTLTVLLKLFETNTPGGKNES